MKLNVSTGPCDSRRLEALLCGNLSEAEERELTLHLNTCEDCRRALTEQAAAPEAWREAEMLLNPAAFVADSDDDDCDAGLPQSSRQSLQIQNVLDALSPTDDPRMLGRLGGYEISGIVGAGGMGVVLKAVDPSLDRTVAIKVMSPHLASRGAARKRFAREAKAAAAVLHPNVIAIHSVSNDEALPYLVMPFVRGTSLQKRLDREGPLSLQETLRIGAQIAAGLAAAHAQGLVHRDIKPGNTLLEEGVERVTITDFGLARAADDATLTHSGMIAGTPQYMSPEQARGEGVDARSDLFSLGSVLYAMCTGRSPFRAETSYGVLRRITDDEPTAIREINPDVPTWLCQIIIKLMAKRPADRYQSAGEVAELLEASLAHVQRPTTVPLPEELRVCRSSTTTRPHRWYMRGMLATAATALAVLLAGVVVVLELNKGELTIESEADDVALRIRQGDEVVEKLTVSRDGKHVRIAAGKYVVEIDGRADSVEVKDGNVTIERDGADIVKIVKRDATGAKVSQRGEQSADGTPPLANEVDRRTGETSRREKSAQRIVQPTSDLDRLQGTWEAEIGSGDNKYLVRFTVEGTNFVEVHRWQSDGREITHRGKIILDESVEPKRMTMKISGASSSGAVRVPGWIPPEVHAIYKLDVTGLTRRTGSREDRPTEFDDKDASQILFNRHERRSGAADLLRAIDAASGAPERREDNKTRKSTKRTEQAPEHDVEGDLARLQGTWVGKTRSGDDEVIVRLTIDGSTFTETRSSQSEGAVTTQGRIELDESTNPKQLTMKGWSISSSAAPVASSIPAEFNAVSVLRGIYKLDDQGFTMRGSTMDRPTEFNEKDTSQITFDSHERRDRSSTQRRVPGTRRGRGQPLDAEKLLVGTWNGHSDRHGESFTFRADQTFDHVSTIGGVTFEGIWELDTQGLPPALLLRIDKSDNPDHAANGAQALKIIGLDSERLTFESPTGVEPLSGKPKQVVFTRSPPQDLRCELRTDKKRWGVGEAPTFVCKIANTGKSKYSTRLEQYFHRVEVNGSPYLWPGDMTSEVKSIGAGGVAEIRFTLAESDWAPLWTAEYRRNKRLQLNPGKHKVRVCIFAASGEGSFTDPGAGPLSPVWSNAVEIEIVAADRDESKAGSSDTRVKSRDRAELEQTRQELLGQWECAPEALEGLSFVLDLKSDGKTGRFVLRRRETAPREFYEGEQHGEWELHGDELRLIGRRDFENGTLVREEDWTTTLTFMRRGDERVLTNSVFGVFRRASDAGLPSGAVAMVGTPQPQSPRRVYRVAFPPDGENLMIGAADKSVSFVDPRTGNEVRKLKLATDSAVYDLAFSPDGKKVASTAFGGQAETANREGFNVSDLQTGNVSRQTSGDRDYVWRMAFLPSGEQLVAGGASLDGGAAIVLWDLTTGKRLQEFTELKHNIEGLSLSADGKALAAASLDGVCVWETDSAKVIHHITSEAERVAVALSPDGQTLAVTEWDYENAGNGPAVHVWSVATRKEIGRLKPEVGIPTALSFSPDGTTLAVASGPIRAVGADTKAAEPQEQAIRLWEVATRSAGPLFRGHQDQVRSLAFSQDGTRLASGSNDGTVLVWDATRHPLDD
jgi:uncharacterized protein (TIGR03067 family)